MSARQSEYPCLLKSGKAGAAHAMPTLPQVWTNASKQSFSATCTKNPFPSHSTPAAWPQGHNCTA